MSATELTRRAARRRRKRDARREERAALERAADAALGPYAPWPVDGVLIERVVAWALGTRHSGEPWGTRYARAWQRLEGLASVAALGGLAAVRALISKEG